jgi:hypothetical protein
MTSSSALTAGLQMPGSSLAEQFPPALAAKAERVWRAAVHPAPRASKLQEDVSRVLWSLGVAHKNNELTADGLFCVDIALDGENVSPAAFVSMLACVRLLTQFSMLPSGCR